MTTIFGNPGSTELPFFREFPDDFRYVLGLQESVVVGMADGYAQATRNAALVNLHSAAGVGHAMGNIFTALPESHADRHHRRTAGTVDPSLRAVSLCDAGHEASRTVREVEQPSRHAAKTCRARSPRAYHIAMQAPCGPTFVSIPVDDWDRTSEPIAKRTVSRTSHPDPDLIATIAERLDRSTTARVRRRAWRRSQRRVGSGRRARRAASGAGVGQPDVIALQLSRAPSAVCRVPAGDPRADRQVPRRT